MNINTREMIVDDLLNELRVSGPNAIVKLEELARRSRMLDSASLSGDAETYRQILLQNWQNALNMVQTLRDKLDAIKEQCNYEY